jgi:hypothetical protein
MTHPSRRGSAEPDPIGTTASCLQGRDPTRNLFVVAFYEPTDDPAVFVCTERTNGPWERGVQHAGPPSALLTRAIERLPSSIPGGSQLTRLTMEILGPIKVGEVRVSATVTRPGRAVELVEGELSSDGRVAVRCRAWRIRTAQVPIPEPLLAGIPVAPPIPADGARFANPGAGTGYLNSVDFIFVTGELWTPGPAGVWTRLRVPLVAGEEPTATQRLMAVADSGNGLSSLFHFTEWWFINTDLTVHLHRIPAGEWIYVDAHSTVDPSGVGLAETELYDEKGRVGRGAQSLMVGPR